MTPEEFVAAVADGRYRVDASRGRMVLRVADSIEQQVVDAVWKRITDGAFQRIAEVLR